MAYSQGHICQCLARILSRRRDSTVSIAGDRRLTGGEFVEGVLALARGLHDSGVRPGDVVAIAALNSDWYLEWLLAITYVGGMAAPLNYRWSFEEARSAMELVRPVMLVFDMSCRSWAAELQNNNGIIPSLKMHAFIGDYASLGFSMKNTVSTMDSMKRHSQGGPAIDLLWAPKGVALICFTSGTTGRSKGVAISHAALIVQSLAKIATVGYGEDDVYLNTAPLCHIGGLSSCIAMLMTGGCHVLIPKFDAKLFIQAIQLYQVSSFITVPTMMADLVEHARKSGRWNGGETVTKILNGGGGLSTELINSAACLFPRAKIFTAYGMFASLSLLAYKSPYKFPPVLLFIGLTESSSSLTFMTLHDPRINECGKRFQDRNDAKSHLLFRQLGGVCVGNPAPHVELRISSHQTPSGCHSSGRILTRGLHVMVGYWGQTAPVISGSEYEGWLDTGDIGWLDNNGNLWLIGRQKGRIKTGGENVYPEEVEAVLSQHPGVSSVAVIGIPDSRLTEKLVACVAIQKDWEWVDHESILSTDVKHVSNKILQDYCRQRNLSGYKIPKNYVLWKKPFPQTSTGKLKREDVRKEAMSSMQFLPSNL